MNREQRRKLNKKYHINYNKNKWDIIEKEWNKKQQKIIKEENKDILTVEPAVENKNINNGK